MKIIFKIFFIVIIGLVVFILNSCTSNSLGETTASNKNENVESLIVHINTVEFKEKIFDFEKNIDWKYNGSKPCIVDFYADWCGPCKMLLPSLKELSEEYKDKIIIYKVNVDNERQLSEIFGITSIPALLFCPMNGKPTMSNGYVAKNQLKEMINTNLLSSK